MRLVAYLIARMLVVAGIALLALSLMQSVGCGNKKPVPAKATVSPRPGDVHIAPLNEEFFILLLTHQGALQVSVKVTGDPIKRSEVQRIVARTDLFCEQVKRGHVTKVRISHNAKDRATSVRYRCQGDESEQTERTFVILP